MKFYATIKDVTGEWVEDYDENTSNPQKYMETIVANFNATANPGEFVRTLVKVDIKNPADTKHSWVKRTDGMSVSFRGRTCDLMYCEKCGITGKRFVLSCYTKRDSKYKAKE